MSQKLSDKIEDSGGKLDLIKSFKQIPKQKFKIQQMGLIDYIFLKKNQKFGKVEENIQIKH